MIVDLRELQFKEAASGGFMKSSVILLLNDDKTTNL
jgi:hypothetical protein